MAEKRKSIPAEAGIRLERAYTHDAAREFDQALRECEAAIELAPSLAEAHNLRGILLEELGRKEEAIEAYRRAVQLAPELEDAALNLSDLEIELVTPYLERAWNLLVAGRLEKALRECEAALEIAPSQARAHNLRGLVLEELGRGAEAAEAYRQAIQLEPDFHDAHVNLSELQAQLTEFPAEPEKELDGMDRLVTIAAFSFPTEAHIAKSKLDAAGIWSFLADEHTITMNWLYSNALHGVKLQVMSSDVERARELLNQGADSTEGAEGALDQEGEPLRCPNCQSCNLVYKRYRLRLVYLSWLILQFPLPLLKRRWICADCGSVWKPQDLNRR